MATYAERAAEIAQVVAAVTGSGAVHDRNRNSAHWGKFILLFRSGGRINGWQISRKLGGTQTQRWDETWQLVKFCGIHDDSASDHLFQQNLDDVAREFVQGRDLSFGTVADGFRVTLIEDRMFGELLAHVAECEIRVSFYSEDL